MNLPIKRIGTMARDKDDPNPRLTEINAQWDRIFPAVKARSGTQVRDFLRDLRKEDLGLFNAIYWRINNWLETRTAIMPLSESEIERGYTRETVGGPRLAELVAKTAGQGNPNNGWWQTKDLPHLFAQIK